MRLEWGKVGERVYETGCDRGVLYMPNASGVYNNGVAWNGLTAVTESPSGAEASPQYADNQKYLNLVSAEEFNATLEALTYPREFSRYEGLAAPIPGLQFTQQNRTVFGLSWRTLIGDDVKGTDRGYKLHLGYGLLAAPSERANATVSDTPEAMPLSWELSSTPVAVGTVNAVAYKPTAHVVITSTDFSTATMTQLEDILYGTAGVDPRLPLPAELYTILSTTLTTSSQPVAPSYNAATDQLTIPTTTGVDYLIDGVIKTGLVTITKDTVVTAQAKPGFKLPAVTDDEFLVIYS